MTVPSYITMLHDWKSLNDWQSSRYTVWRVVVFSVRKQMLIILELHKKFPSVYIIRRLMPCSQESGTGRTRVPHEPSSRVHAVCRNWNKFYCCLLLPTRARFFLQVFEVKVCSHLSFQVCCMLCPLIVLYRFIHISHFPEHPHLPGYSAVWGEKCLSHSTEQSVSFTTVHFNVTSFR